MKEISFFQLFKKIIEHNDVLFFFSVQ